MCGHVYQHQHVFIDVNVFIWRECCFIFLPSAANTQQHTLWTLETLSTVLFLHFPNNVTRLAGQPIIPPLALPDVIRGEGTSGLVILLPIRKRAGYGVSTSVWAVAKQKSSSQRTSSRSEINFAILFFLFTFGKLVSKWTSFTLCCYSFK